MQILESLDSLAYCLGWIDIASVTVLMIGAGLPARVGRAPRGMVRCLFYGVGLVLCRHDLQPALCSRLQEIGYRFFGLGRWHLGLALPGRVRRVAEDRRWVRAD
ncbi:hypothetical protein GN316_08185 [Xylophilus sp. Kf1]|nr:hypothetical protein [Xylophilus sp. Kf1]